MLHGLDDVDWTSLDHAEGSAADIPLMIRSMVSDDPGIRQQAFCTAYGNLYLEGSVFRATAPAVPFLIEIAATPRLPDRHRVLELLFHVAHARRDVGDDMAPTCDESRWVQAASQAVAHGWPEYIRLLEDPAADVRRQAARMLTCCPDQRVRVVPPLANTFDSDIDAGARATALYAIAVMAATDEATLIERALGDEEPLVRLSAALSSSFFLGHPPSTPVIDTLIEFLEAPDSVEYEGLLFGEDCASDVGAALARVQGPRRTEVAQRLLRVAENDRAAPLTVAEPLIVVTFGAGHSDMMLSELDILQRRALIFVASKAWSRNEEGGWSVSSALRDLLAEHGLARLGREVIGYPGSRRTLNGTHNGVSRLRASVSE